MAGKGGTLEKFLPETTPKRRHPLHPLCARTAFSTNKLAVFVYALVFLFVGIVLMAIGVFVELHRDRIEAVNNRLALPTALLILVGLIITLNALAGMVGAVLEKPGLLKIFLVVTIFCFLVQMAIGIIAFVFREQLPSMMSSEFIFAVKSYGRDGEVTEAMDWLQGKYQCCGFASYMDYQKENPDFNCTSTSEKACGVPSTCCRQTEGAVLPKDCGYKLKSPTNIHSKGCIDSFLLWLMEHLDLVGAIALGFAIPQIFGILLAYYFIRKVKEYRVWFRVDKFRG